MEKAVERAGKILDEASVCLKNPDSSYMELEKTLKKLVSYARKCKVKNFPRAAILNISISAKLERNLTEDEKILFRENEIDASIALFKRALDFLAKKEKASLVQKEKKYLLKEDDRVGIMINCLFVQLAYDHTFRL